jgi:hypothetical protein
MDPSNATLLDTHATVQDLKVVVGPTAMNPERLERSRKDLAKNDKVFVDTSFSASGATVRGAKAEKGGRVTAKRHEGNLRAAADRTATVPPLVSGFPDVPSSPRPPTPKELSKELALLSLPPLHPNSAGTPNAATRATGPSALMTHLAEAREVGRTHRQRTLKPRATAASLVESVVSRSATSSVPASVSVYACSCCRPRGPASVAASSVFSHGEDDRASLYEGLTSVSQRGGNDDYMAAVLLAPDVNGAAPGDGRWDGAVGRAIHGATKLHRSAGCAPGLTSALLLKQSRGSMVADGNDLTSTSHHRNQRHQRGADEASRLTSTVQAGRTSHHAASSVRSSQVRDLEVQLEKERADRMRTQQELEAVRERQERLLKALSSAETRQMTQLMGGAGGASGGALVGKKAAGGAGVRPPIVSTIQK